MMVKEKNKEKTRGGKKRGGEKIREIFWNLKEGWVNGKKEKKHPPQGLVWFRFSDLVSSQNGHPQLVHWWVLGHNSCGGVGCFHVNKYMEWTTICPMHIPMVQL
jgi:hypothetical protein